MGRDDVENEEANATSTIHPFSKQWSSIHATSQWRYVNHILYSHPSNWTKRLCDFTTYPRTDPPATHIPHENEDVQE